MEFKIESEGYCKNNLWFQNNIVAESKYKNWYSLNNPRIVIPQKGSFFIKYPSIWKQNFHVIQNEIVFFEVSFGWNSKTTIIDVKNNRKKYVLKNEKFFSLKYILEDENGNELLEFTSKYNWKTFKKTYYFNCKSNLENPNLELLIFIIFEIININTRMASGL